MYTADPVTGGPEAADAAADAPPRPSVRQERVRAALRRAAPALAVYAAVRLLGVVCLALWCRHIGMLPRARLGASWDGAWYGRIAAYGYGTVIPSPDMRGVFYDDQAFFPLYPLLIRTAAAAAPIGPVDAALLVSWTASLAAAWGIYMVGELLHGRRTGVVLAVLWGVLPHALVQSMAYTESLLTAFAAWALYAVLTGRWPWAGALALLAGLTRPNGIAVAAAVWAAAALPARWRTAGGRGPGERAPQGRGPDGWRDAGGGRWLAVVLAPLGWLGYMLYVGGRTGRLDGYFAVQRSWGSEFDFGVNSARYARDLVTNRAYLVSHVALLLVAVAVVLFAHCVLARQPLPLLVYSGVLLVITLGGTNYFQCKPRFLLPAFALLLPAAHALARARLRTAALLLAALAAGSASYGTYLLTVSLYAL